MNTILEPLLAILAIVVPLVLAYVILLLQSREPACGCWKPSVTIRDDLLPERVESSRAVEKHAAR